jgi:hypothetical protein
MNGTVQCWGAGNEGQLGDGSMANSAVPVTVSGLTDALSAAGSGGHVCAVRANGRVVCWGSNTNGQLGDGTTDSSPIPITVSGLSDAIGVSVGGATSCALRAGGEVACWGNNLDGQLGDGTFTSSSLPVPAYGIDDAIEVSVDSNLTCVLRANGAVRCFGEGNEGQLGNALPGTASPVAAATLRSSKPAMIERFAAAQSFLAVAQPFLMEHENENAVLAIALRLAGDPSAAAAPYFAVARADGHVCAAAACAVPGRLAVSWMRDATPIPALTDITNPTANSVYRKLGYRMIGGASAYALE